MCFDQNETKKCHQAFSDFMRYLLNYNYNNMLSKRKLVSIINIFDD